MTTLVAVTHSCGHGVDWDLINPPMPYWRETMSNFSCPWCGGEAGPEPVPASETVAWFPEVGTATRVSGAA